MSKWAIIAASSVFAVVVAGFLALYLWSDPPESAPTVGLYSDCQTLHCGPLRLTDCGSGTDGPLLVFSRFPERFLADCGYWVMGKAESLCLTVYRVQHFCSVPG